MHRVIDLDGDGGVITAHVDDQDSFGRFIVVLNLLAPCRVRLAKSVGQREIAPISPRRVRDSHIIHRGRVRQSQAVGPHVVGGALAGRPARGPGPAMGPPAAPPTTLMTNSKMRVELFWKFSTGTHSKDNP